MAQLYANENFPLPVVEELRRFGRDVLTTYESGRARIAVPDDEVLAFSVAEKRVLLRINRKHFIRLHRQKPEHTGIIVYLDCYSMFVQAKAIIEASTFSSKPGFVRA